jgi:predicted DCC family thiol-disulfide oxidoreductase YuxK
MTDRLSPDSSPPSESGRPVLIFDGECKFCCFWVERWRDSTAGRVDFQPFQTVADHYPAISLQEFKRAVQLIEPNGRTSSGADAVLRMMEFGKSPLRWMGRMLPFVPGALPVARALYGFVARHRSGLSRLMRLS